MFKCTSIHFEKLAVFLIPADNWMSLLAVFFSEQGFPTDFFKMLVSTLVFKTTVASVVVITLEDISVRKHICVL